MVLYMLQYILLATTVTAPVVYLPLRPVQQSPPARSVRNLPPQPQPARIMIRAGCFNINPCPDRNRNRWTRPTRPWTVSTQSPPRRLIIRTRYIQDITTTKPTTTEMITTEVTTVSSTSALPTTATTTVPPVTDEPVKSTTTTTTTTTESTVDESTTIEQPTETSPDISHTIEELPSKHDKSTKYVKNPCLYGKPLTNEAGSYVICDPNERTNPVCPENYWCHTGSKRATTVCCPLQETVDRCDEVMTPGKGGENLIRWYFNPTSGQCERFTYHGTLGNANNYMTEDDCLDDCLNSKEETMNPCKYGEPAKGFDKKRLICDSPESLVCPKGFYCHIGVTSSENACCERSGMADPCSLPLDLGEGGKSGTVRYYFDPKTRRCLSFIYQGKKGNENNFLDLKECQQQCMRWEMVCEKAPSVKNRHACSLTDKTCVNGQWCHIGSNSYNTICCAGAVENPCELPVAYGTGNESLLRWYADPQDRSCSRQCRSFAYKGFKGNQNNFLTKDECERQCKPVCENVCGSGTMLTSSNGSPRYCSAASACPKTFWCHFGGSTESTVCCSEASDPCTQPMTEGNGSYSLTRWYFDINSKSCKQFYYKGSGGNQNSFLTEESCQRACPSFANPCSSGEPILVDGSPKVCSPDDRCPQTHYCHLEADELHGYCCPKEGNPCDLPMIRGEGLSVVPRFYYDKKTHRCREFAYRGSKGNANNFLTLSDCESMCPSVPNPCSEGEPLLNTENEPLICGGSETCPSGYYCHVGATPETTNCCPGDRDACQLPLKVGKGKEMLDRWYFDKNVELCKKFNYRGLQGNANNFVTREACQSRCKEMNPCGEGEPLTDKSGERILCNPGISGICPKEYFCHIGTSSITTLCCLRQGSNQCEQMMEVGRGKEHTPRWFFDVGKKKCVEFEYGGLGGNENNFLSMKSCEEACQDNQEYCPHGDPLMDASGQNLETCGVHKACPNGYICNMNIQRNTTACCQDPANFCLQPMDPGECTNFETRYGYEPASDTCVPYEYGGCGGTLNNFESLQKCTEICCKNE